MSFQAGSGSGKLRPTFQDIIMNRSAHLQEVIRPF